MKDKDTISVYIGRPENKNKEKGKSDHEND
jgi:hypothetical protein